MKKNISTINSKVIQILLSLVILISSTAQAAEFCVDTTAALYLALLAAQSNNEDDQIKVVQGTYTTTGVGAFTYISGQTFELKLEGGYTASCSSRDLIPSNTILDGNNANRVLHINQTDGDSDLEIEGFTIQNGRSNDVMSGTGIRVVGNFTFTGAVRIRSNIIKLNANISQIAAGISVFSFGHCSIVNNLIHDNTATDYSAAIISCFADFNNFYQNTVTENTSVSNNGGVRFSGNAKLNAVNNIVWNNSNIDLTIASDSNELISNNIGSQSGLFGAGSDNNISVEPKFKSISDFRLQTNSPSVGTGSIPNISVLFASALRDLDGNPRVFGIEIDMGAYQSDLSDLCVTIPVKPSGAVVFCL